MITFLGLAHTVDATPLFGVGWVGGWVTGAKHVRACGKNLGPCLAKVLWQDMMAKNFLNCVGQQDPCFKINCQFP